MDTESLHDSTVSIDDGDIGESSCYQGQQEGTYTDGGMERELSSAKELLTLMELDIACSTERMVNLNLLMFHVAERASHLEATLLDDRRKEEETLADSVEDLLEFDFLSGIFDAEVRQLGDIVATLLTDILNARETISSGQHLGKFVGVILERSIDSEKTLKQLQGEVSDLTSQSAKLQRILSNFRNKYNLQEHKDAYDLENSDFLRNNAKIKLQTSEQKRHILRMLEKSLATEMDLEKKLIESKNMEEELKSRMHSSAGEVLSLEEQALVLLQRLFEADSAAEVLKGFSRELMGQLQLSQFSLNGASQREAGLKCTIESSQTLTLKEKSEIAALKERVFLVESRADSAEGKCKLLEETIATLKEELQIMRSCSSPAEIVESLKSQLQEADIQLQNAVACVEASEEKQTMLYSTIKDMQTVFDGLKSKVLNAEARAETAEDKWIMISESNADVTEELSLLRQRLECLEASSQQAEEAKAASSKDIKLRTEVIMDLVMQLAVERERLQKQASSVMKENRFLVESLQETKKGQSVDTGFNPGKSNGLQEFEEGKSSIATEEKQKQPTDASEDEPTSLNPRKTDSLHHTPQIYEPGRDLHMGHCYYVIFLLAGMTGLAMYLLN